MATDGLIGMNSIDTTTSGGKLIFHIFGALAEFERDIIRERTNAGLIAARARGKQGGRPKSIHTRLVHSRSDLCLFLCSDVLYRRGDGGLIVER
jgi:DNA invertase Pin-like site-specific DNA recombinase